MAYVASVVLDAPRPNIVSAAPQLVIAKGIVTISSYDATKVEITGITGRFRSPPTVILGGFTSLGYPVYWDPATKSIKAFAGVAGAEVANSTNIGSVSFVAFASV